MVAAALPEPPHMRVPLSSCRGQGVFPACVPSFPVGCVLLFLLAFTPETTLKH